MVGGEVVGVLAVSGGEVAPVLVVDEETEVGMVRLDIMMLEVALHNADSVSMHVLPGSQQPPWLQ
jgi:hypothetical protein